MREFFLLLAASCLTSAVEASSVRISVQPVEALPESEPVPVVLRLVPQAGEKVSREVSLKAPGDVLIDDRPRTAISLKVILEPPVDPYGQPWRLRLSEDRAPDEPKRRTGKRLL